MQINYKILFPKHYFSGIQRIWYQIMVILLLLLFLVITTGCDSHKGTTDYTEGQTPDVDVTVHVKQLSEATAISKVRLELQRTNKSITLPTYYWTYETKRVPCDQYDKDRGRNCTGAGGTAQYGYKSEAVSVRKCCRDRTINIAGAGGRWKAVYAEAEDSWAVACELSIDDIKKVLTWSLGDKNGIVSETSQ